MAKIKVTYVGNFVELGHDNDPEASSLSTSRWKRPPGNKAEVVAYLRSATTLIMSPGCEEDVFSPGRDADAASVMTDGVYAWPKTLSYYVDVYDIELPAEFEKHMERNRWIPAPVTNKLALEII